MPSQTTTQMEILLESVFASKKMHEQKKTGQVAPSVFQVSAKIDEESRKDNRLVLSFLLTLNEPKSLATYEFRGSCEVTGSPADFDDMMQAGKKDDSRLPKILDVIYQKLYPAVFLLAGITSSPYPQYTTVAAQSVETHDAEQEQEESAQILSEEKPTEIPTAPKVESCVGSPVLRQGP